jgi:outer membrane autotransporter protein
MIATLASLPMIGAEDLPADGIVTSNLTLSAGDATSVDQLVLISGSGEVTLTVDKAQLSITQDATVGKGGEWLLSLSNEGSVDIGQNLYLGDELVGYELEDQGIILYKNGEDVLCYDLDGNQLEVSFANGSSWDDDSIDINYYINGVWESASFELASGTQVSSSGVGNVIVSGELSSLTIGGSAYVGYANSGSLTISQGGTASVTGDMYIGYAEGVEGNVSVSGENSSLSVGGKAYVGYSGEGSLTISGGATMIADDYFYVGYNNNSVGTVEISGAGSSLSLTKEYDSSLCIGPYVYKGACEGKLIVSNGAQLNTSTSGNCSIGTGSLIITSGGTANLGSITAIGGGTEYAITVSGEGSILNFDQYIMCSTSLSAILSISDHGAVYGGQIALIGGTLSMTSDSVLVTKSVAYDGASLESGSKCTMQLGGTNNVGALGLGTNTSLTLLASGASVAQGGIVVSKALRHVALTYTTSSDYSGQINLNKDWNTDVCVEFDLSREARDLIGNKIYLIKADSGYEYFGNGLYIAGEWKEESEEWVPYSTTVDGKTISFEYLFDGVAITFGDTVTINDETIDVHDLPPDNLLESTSVVTGKIVSGEVSQTDGLSVYTPSTIADDPLHYVVAEGVSADSAFTMATTSYTKETTTIQKNSYDEVISKTITVDDIGISDLTLYANATQAVIAGGTVGLTASEVATDLSDVGIPSMVNNVLVKNYGSVTMTDGAVVNADRKLESSYGTISLDGSTMNIGGGNLDEFRNNSNVRSSQIDWQSLASSTVDNSTVNLASGSSLNVSQVEDDEVPSTFSITKSTMSLSDASSMNVGEGVETRLADSTLELSKGSSVNFLQTTAPVTIEDTIVDLSGHSSFNGTKGGDMTVTHSTVQGTGTVSNFTSKENTYNVGKDNTGVLELRNVKSYSDVMSTSIVGARVVSGTYHNDATEGTGVISQLKITDGTTITDGAFQLAVIGDSSLLTEGSSFQVLDLDAPLEGGFTSFTETGTPLMDGYAWDYSLLNSQGIVSIILTELGDAPRVANTMYSSAKAVSYAGRVAMDHLQGYYGGPHDYHAEGNNFWVSSLGTYQCVANHKGRTGYTYQSMGYAVGYDRVFHEDRVIEGFDIGQTWGKHRPKQGTARYTAGKIDQDAVVATLYGMETLIRTINDRHVINLEHYVAYGSVRNKSSKTALFNNQTATAKWDDDVWCFGLRGVWNRQINEHWTVSPFVGIDYEHVSSDDFTESMGNNTARYTGGNYQNWDVSVGTAASYNMKFQNGMEVTPTASVAYVGSISRNVPTVSVSDGNGKSVREKAVNPGRNAFQASAGVNWKISQDWNMSANYDFYVAHGTTEHNANVMVSYAF